MVRPTACRFALLLAVLALFATPVAAAPITVTDIAGREVTLAAPAKKVILGDARDVLALALLHPDPVGLLAGWPGNLRENDPATYALLATQNPAIDTVPVIGKGEASTFSLEAALAARPDLAIFSSGHGPTAKSREVIALLEQAGIPILFIDFSAHPLQNTLPSIKLLGQVLGREREAAAYGDLYLRHLSVIEQRLLDSPQQAPGVMLHMHAVGWDCCFSPGNGNLGEFIEFVGGHNIGADVLPGPLGQLSREYVLSAAPTVYIATGGPHLKGKGGVVLGTGIALDDARIDLAKVAQHTDLAGLPAMQSGNVHALWHNFYASPLNILALEAMARWIHPVLFADLDPQKTLAEINGMLPVRLTGTFWVDSP
jgi:iron complex transport system substrate-binding protein